MSHRVEVASSTPRWIGYPFLMPVIFVKQLGSCARDWLSQASSAWLIGRTSRGCFLRLSNRRVIFLSYEDFAGPLTLNQRQPAGRLPQIPDRCAAIVSANTIHFSEVDLKIQLESARVWEPPERCFTLLSPAEMKARVGRVASQLFLSRAPSKLASQVLNISGIFPMEAVSGLNPKLARLPTALIDADVDHISEIFAALLGNGPGLTPAGDDLAIGFLLALGRWGDRLFTRFNTTRLSQELTSFAHQATTTLSANLIECAAKGQADERLIQALDGCVVGTPGEEICVESLLAWGNSSGVDAFCGMAMAIQFGLHGKD